MPPARMDIKVSEPQRIRAEFNTIWLALRGGEPRACHDALGRLASWLTTFVKPQLARRYPSRFSHSSDLYPDVLQESLYRLVRHCRKPEASSPDYPVAYCFRVMHNVFIDMHRTLAADAMGHLAEIEADDGETLVPDLPGDIDAALDDLHHRQALLNAAAVMGGETLAALLKHDHGLWVRAAGRSRPRYGQWLQMRGEYRLERWDIHDIVRWRQDSGQMREGVKDGVKSARSWLSDMRKRLFALLRT